MLLPGENSPKTWVFLTILVSTIIAISESSAPKTLDIKIGFDLTQGSNGAPSLRIRDFQESAEYNPRAVDDASSSDSSSKKKTSPRAETSESEDREERERPKKEESSKEPAKPAKSSNDSDDDDDDKSSASREEKLRSTRGLKAGDFEPEEENPKIHARYQKNSESENNSDESRRRYRRHIGRYEYKQ